jgi:hypothetical protein
MTEYIVDGTENVVGDNQNDLFYVNGGLSGIVHAELTGGSGSNYYEIFTYYSNDPTDFVEIKNFKPLDTLDTRYILSGAFTEGDGSSVGAGEGQYQQVGANLFLYLGSSTLGAPPGTQFTIELDNVSFNQLVISENIITLGTLFTTGADTVNFNSLTSAQQSAIAAGADVYDGLGGDDVVTLPNKANYNESVGDGKTLKWDNSRTQPFSTDSKAGDLYTVNGGDGNYYIDAGAGTDDITINGSGTSYVTPGTGTLDAAITGGGTIVVKNSDVTPVLGSATIGANSTFELSGGASGGPIDFTGPKATLRISGTMMPTNVISEFASGDVFDLSSLPLGQLSGAFLSNSNGTWQLASKALGYQLNLSQTSTPFDFTVSADGSGGTKYTAKYDVEAIQKASEGANTYNTYSTAVIKSLRAVSSAIQNQSAALAVEQLEGILKPYLGALDAAIALAPILAKFENDFAKAKGDPTAIRNAVATAASSSLKAGLESTLSTVLGGAAAALTTGVTEAALGWAATATVDGFFSALLVDGAIVAGVTGAPVVAGVAAAVGVGLAVKYIFDKYSVPIQQFIQNAVSPIVNDALPDPIIIHLSSYELQTGQQASSFYVSNSGTLDVRNHVDAGE